MRFVGTNVRLSRAQNGVKCRVKEENLERPSGFWLVGSPDPLFGIPDYRRRGYVIGSSNLSSNSVTRVGNNRGLTFPAMTTYSAGKDEDFPRITMGAHW